MIWAGIFSAFLAIFIYSLKYKVSGFEKVCMLIDSLNQDQKELLTLHSCVFNISIRESVDELVRYVEKSGADQGEAVAEYFSMKHMRDLKEYQHADKESRYSGVYEIGGIVLELIYCLEHADMYHVYSPIRWFYMLKLKKAYERAGDLVNAMESVSGKKVIQRKLQMLINKSRENIKAGNYEQAFDDLENLYEIGLSL